MLSPGDRSYDAIGLMKQVSEQTAVQYANAHEILENQTHKALLPRDASGNDRDEEQENNDPNNQPVSHSHLSSNALVKLDLSNPLIHIFTCLHFLES